MRKMYLGDGVYVSEGAYHGELVLTTENGIATTNRIVLGPAEFSGLEEFRRSLVKESVTVTDRVGIQTTEG